MRRTVIAVVAILAVAGFTCGARNLSEEKFARPDKDNYPQTWFHFIDGNVDKEGITKDLEAIAGAGISGIHFFHGGQFGGDWPGVRQHISCLSPLWNDALEHTASEAKRLGLRFTMQNCPGWSLAGGPWIKPEDSMRNLVYSETHLSGYAQIEAALPAAFKQEEADWRDYRDIAVLAFPTPEGKWDVPEQVRADENAEKLLGIMNGEGDDYRFPGQTGNPHWIEVTYAKPISARSLVLIPDGQFNHGYSYEIAAGVKVVAIASDGSETTVLDSPLPMFNWQDDRELTFALDEVTASRYRIIIDNRHDLSVDGIRLVSAARKNNWEAEAATTLRSNLYGSEYPCQSSTAYINPESVMDISAFMDADGLLRWSVPAGDWTILRIGHVNSGHKNGPAPLEATGFECNKLSFTGADKHFAGYIQKAVEGPAKGKLDAMLLDSWECKSQTWTAEMEDEFADFNGYQLRGWMPALFGYVMGSQQTTADFLHDWRACINYLFVNKFWGRMAEHAKDAGLQITYETAAGDVFPADVLEFFKYADIPMCEFWQDPQSDGYVGSLNFKPIRPTSSAARLYGKGRTAAESLTSFALTWDEHFSRLKDVCNQNYAQGVTYSVFHTYTHNPCADTMVPGTSFGSGIGTPFLRGQTWWKHMPEFTGYLARLSYMLESGHPVSDVLWYLGDASMHRPDQHFDFATGFNYDYCNQDVLLNRLSVRNGRLVTPEGIEYSVLWMPDNHAMLPATAAKVRELVEAGATVIGDAPLGIGTLVTSADVKAACGASVSSYKDNVKALWGGGSGIRRLGKGRVISGMSLEAALAEAGLAPDVLENGGKTGANWLHRRDAESDWYFITAPLDGSFRGTLDFGCEGSVSIWDPVSGESGKAVSYRKDGDRTLVDLDLPYAGSCFVVFNHSKAPAASAPASVCVEEIPFGKDWTLSFPEGWGAPAKLSLESLAAWKDLPISDEGKAFSGTATYENTLNIKKMDAGASYVLNLGSVEEVAKVYVNGTEVRTLWCEPFRADITSYLHKGRNRIVVEVTSTWYNRLAYDAGRKEDARKTWVISGPDAGSDLRPSGLIGPVTVSILK